MTRLGRLRLVVVTGVLAAAAAVAPVAGATVAGATAAGATGLLTSGVPASPDDLPAPTAQQLAASVRIWEPNGVRVWEPDGVRVWDPSGSIEQLEVEVEEEGAQTVVTLSSDILFSFDSADLPPSAEPRLAELVQGLPQGAPVAVIGHTDSRADDAYNLELSQRRTQAAADALVAQRPDLVLAVEGRGETEPVAQESTGGEDDAAARAQNRRVEIRCTG